ncbi:hypothetical protein OF83DRAFT_33924 [Amylostereum chailletii]|nr:hypothetical protein OF83DRAFT_33924 [Amylostereum chailletii]
MGTNPPDTWLTFDTPPGVYDTVTTVYKIGGVATATFSWFGGSAIGTATVCGRNMHMGDMVVMQGYPQGVRAFRSAGPDGVQGMFTWRRCGPGSYDLSTASGVRIGMYRTRREMSPIGEIYATFYYNFLHEPLFLDAMLSLCINRWMDRIGNAQMAA